MAIKKVKTVIKLQIPAAQATPAPPVGPALGQHGLNIAEFCKKFNEQTKDKAGNTIPVEITVYEDRSYSFILKTPPTSELIKKASGIEGALVSRCRKSARLLKNKWPILLKLKWPISTPTP